MEEIKTKSKKMILIKIVALIITATCLLSIGQKVDALGYADLIGGRILLC